MVPVAVPTIRIETPGKGIPSSELVTVPLISLSCARRQEDDKNSKKNKDIIFIFLIIQKVQAKKLRRNSVHNFHFDITLESASSYSINMVTNPN
jgi:hypothetical protein